MSIRRRRLRFGVVGVALLRRRIKRRALESFRPTLHLGGVASAGPRLAANISIPETPRDLASYPPIIAPRMYSRMDTAGVQKVGISASTPAVDCLW